MNVVGVALDPHVERSGEGPAAYDIESRAGKDPDGTQVTKSFALRVRHALYRNTRSLARIPQATLRKIGHRSVFGRDRVTVGVGGRVSEPGCDSLLQFLGQNVLEDLCLRMDLIPGHAQSLGEIGLQEAVMTDHLESDLATGLGEGRAPVIGVLDQ